MIVLCCTGRSSRLKTTSKYNENVKEGKEKYLQDKFFRRQIIATYLPLFDGNPDQQVKQTCNLCDYVYVVLKKCHTSSENIK